MGAETQTETMVEREIEPEPGASAITDEDLDHQLQELKALLENLHSAFGAKEDAPEEPDGFALAS
jgi:hypothetical protein